MRQITARLLIPGVDVPGPGGGGVYGQTGGDGRKDITAPSARPWAHGSSRG